ncbi:unnamed protein product [Rhodiola kirilowii]
MLEFELDSANQIRHSSCPLKPFFPVREGERAMSKEMIRIPNDLVDQEPEEWLPLGWTVKYKVRSDGRRDKFYFSPSGESQFNSKVGVCRHLGLDPKTIDRSAQPKTPCVQSNSSAVDPNLSPEASTVKTAKKTNSPCLKPVARSTPSAKKQNRSRDSDSDSSLQKVSFERVPAEGLPPGWIKEIKIQKIRGKIRRDPYYTDPISGYVFRSLKDSLRYIETGEPGRLAFKPKSPDVAEAVKLVGNKRKLQLVDSPAGKSNESPTDEKAGPIRKCGKKGQHGAGSSKMKKEPSLPRRSSGRITALKEKTEIQSNGQSSKSTAKNLADTEAPEVSFNDSREESKRFNQLKASSRSRSCRAPSKSPPYISSADTTSILPRYTVKTLTGTIPAGKDISVHDYIGQSQGDDDRIPPGFSSKHASKAKLDDGNWNNAELSSVKLGTSGNAVGSASRCNWVRGTDRSLFR